MSGRRTACGVVHNTTLEDFSVENPVGGNSIGIPAGGKTTFWCTELFWECDNTSDNSFGHGAVRANALRFRWGSTSPSTGSDSFYMFMQKTTMNIMWTFMPDGTYENAVQVFPGAARDGCLDVWIYRDPTQDVPHGRRYFYPTAVRQI